MMNQFLPCRYFISECVHHNIFPLWCSYINFGYPFYADPQSGLFYPVTWIIALTTGYNVYTICLEYVIHVAIAGVAFFFLLKSFGPDNYTAVVFGIIYCMSGVFTGNAQHLPWIISMAWMPLILLNFKNLFDKPALHTSLALALFLYLAVTGGYPGFFIILFYFFAAYGAVKVSGNIIQKDFSSIKPVVLFFVLAGIVFVILTGGYLYSFIHSLPYIARGKPVSLSQANNVALTPRSMVSFFFPFATACTSFKLDTDISMANIYCGFLLLPLLFIALVKVRMQFFHKAIFAFAVICLLAAAGRYFYVRTWFYHFLPGLNMLRHAAIFRVFTMLGFVFIAASGFAWLLSAVRAKTNTRFVKMVFSLYFLMLAAVLLFILFRHGFGFNLPPLFSTTGIAAFNAHQGLYEHITAQLIFQLVLLGAFMAVLLSGSASINTKTVLMSCIVIADIFISVQLNLPATVVSDIKPSVLQAKLDRLSTGFPVPPLTPMDNFTHYSDGSTLPIWYNLSFFKKTPAKDGFNSFYLQNVDDLNASARLDSFLKMPVIFFKNAGTKFSITKFGPGNIVIQCKPASPDIICLQQNFYYGWGVVIDGKKEVPRHELCSMSAAIPAGEHTISFEYHKKEVKYLLLLSALSLILTTGFLIKAKWIVPVS